MAARWMQGAWWVDFRLEGARIRKKSPIDTKRGAEEYERQLRNELADAAAGVKKEVPVSPAKEVPTLATFQKEFVATYAKSNNKPSEVAAKESAFKLHLVPELGHLRLDEIDPRSIERFKTKKLSEKLKPKTINNDLTILGKTLS